MIAFYIALIIGAVVAVVYLALMIEEFLRARRQFNASTRGDRTRRAAATADGADPERPTVYERQGRNFSWIAGAGVVVSTSLLVLVSVTPSAWYVLPFLGIGSAVAVIVAFLIDRRTEAPGRTS